MTFGIVAYALLLFSWSTFVETAVYNVVSGWNHEIVAKIVAKSRRSR